MFVRNNSDIIYPSSTDLNFDTKPSPSGQNENIFSQPRASSTSPHQQYSFSNSTSGSNVNAEQVNNLAHPSSTVRTHQNSNATTSPTSPISPVISVNSSSDSTVTSPSSGSKPNLRRSSQTQDGRPISKSSTSTHRTEELPAVHEQLPRSRVDKLRPKIIDLTELANSECDCSDDETISKFTKEYMKASPSNENDIRHSIQPEPGPSGSSNCGSKTKGDSSNASSFEELASGTSNGDWLFITKSAVDDAMPAKNATSSIHSTQPPNDDSNTSANINLTHLTFQNAAAHSSQQNICPGTSVEHQQRVRRLVRRRSDGSIYNSSGSKLFADILAEEDVEEVSEEETLRKRTKTSSCDKCGKSKRSLKRHVAKFKRQLETTNASEIEIKKQLDAFLEYLETCNKNSMEGTDTESNDDRIDSANNAYHVDTNPATLGDGDITDFEQLNDDDDDDNYDFEYDEGIHVYGTDHDETKGQTPRHFVDINDYESR